MTWKNYLRENDGENLNIYIVCVGKIKEKYIVDGMNEFLKRMKPFAKINILELKEYTKEESVNASIEKESEEILKTLNRIDAYKIALDLNGKDFSSTEMAKHISNLAVNGISSLCFVIGGSNGYNENVLKAVDLRLILMEQIYRWFCTINNIKYHK